MKKKFKIFKAICGMLTLLTALEMNPAKESSSSRAKKNKYDEDVKMNFNTHAYNHTISDINT